MLQKTKWGGIYDPKCKDIINWFVNGLAQVIALFVSQGNFSVSVPFSGLSSIVYPW
jgi:hypothetical protein